MNNYLLARLSLCLLAWQLAGADANPSAKQEEAGELKACAEMVLGGLQNIAPTREKRFEAKVSEAAAICRGGQRAAVPAHAMGGLVELLGNGRHGVLAHRLH